MARMSRALRDAGWQTLNVDYPSRTRSIEDLADGVHRASAAFIHDGPGRVHFVTHSMGGLVARAYVARHRPPCLGHAVMLGPPHQGSELADRLGGLQAYRWFFGPAGSQLGTAAARPDAAVDYPVGIIAGTRSVDPVAWLLLPRPNDGRVPVARTMTASMMDHVTVPTTHAFMMRNRAVILQTIHFLRHGRFAPGG